MRTRFLWRCVTRGWTSWPIRARTATTVSAPGGRTSGPRSRTTPSSSAGGNPPPHGARLACRRAPRRENEVIDAGVIARWTAEHDGYFSLDPPASHRRSVLLDRASRSVDIVDQIEGGQHDLRLAFHLGPEVEADLSGCGA